MKEELLNEIKEEYNKKKEELKEYNDKVLRVRTLKNNKFVKEYIKLVGDNNKYKYKNKNDIDIVGEIYQKYLSRIKEDETNNIYFYLGTYRYYYRYDIDKGGVDKRVRYNDPLADYRLYWNIEGMLPIKVEKDRFDEFDKENTIITTYYKSNKDYFFIQKEFFTESIKNNQEEAKKILKKKYKIK